MVAVSHSPLRPRQVRHEPTPDEIREERRRNIREAIHADLHRLYDRYSADHYDGEINTHDGVPGIIPGRRATLASPGAGSVRALGVELHPEFIEYLGRDHPQSALWKALLLLRTEWPNLHQIIWAHLADNLTDDEIGEMFHLDRKTVAKRMDRGFDILAGKLGAWRTPANN